MNLGAPELLIILLIGFAFLYCTVYGAIRAATNGDTGWLVGIIFGWVVGAGWAVGLVYLVWIDRGRASRSPVPPPPPTGLAPPTSPAGWIVDPTGRFELRYWDGTRWTEHVSTAGQQSTNPP
jgi:hypothetical protein